MVTYFGEAAVTSLSLPSKNNKKQDLLQIFIHFTFLYRETGYINVLCFPRPYMYICIYVHICMYAYIYMYTKTWQKQPSCRVTSVKCHPSRYIAVSVNGRFKCCIAIHLRVFSCKEGLGKHNIWADWDKYSRGFCKSSDMSFVIWSFHVTFTWKWNVTQVEIILQWRGILVRLVMH